MYTVEATKRETDFLHLPIENDFEIHSNIPAPGDVPPSTPPGDPPVEEPEKPKPLVDPPHRTKDPKGNNWMWEVKLFMTKRYY